MNKIPYNNSKCKKAERQHTNAIKNFDFTEIVDRLRTLSWIQLASLMEDGFRNICKSSSQLFISM